jgi:hypothetical protein
MDTTLLSLLAFSVITIIYYTTGALGRPNLTLDILSNKQGELDTYFSDKVKSLGIYLLFIIIIQVVINVIYMVNKCGGATGSNVAVAMVSTIFPWLFLFGIAMATIIMFPGLKSAFTDVVGYFFVAKDAKNLLTYILADVKTENNIQGLSSEEQNKIRLASDALLKICADKSILINQMVPENFLQFWQTLEQGNLLKSDIPDLDAKKAELLELVVQRDYVGEATWYIVTSLLVISIVSYNLIKRGCKQDVSSIQANQQEYLAKQQQIDKTNELTNNQVYTLDPKQTPSQTAIIEQP